MIPSGIIDGIVALETAVTALGDLKTATRYDVGLVQQQASILLGDINDAILTASGDLDGIDAAADTPPAPLQEFDAEWGPEFTQNFMPAALPRLVGGDPVLFPGELPAFLIGLQQACVDQAWLVRARGFVGRAVFNLAQA